ncbi:MAG TPA: hypothetical protein VKA15_13115 [Isosphaeraceae bacterium]|nr:hypothetical protein [Isosphaeraceae bacterium]
MAALVDKRRTRTPAGALIELSALANEKLLLDREVSRATRRDIEIQRRLREIAAKADRLMKLAQGGTPPPETSPLTRPVSSDPPRAPVEMPASSRFKISEFTY